MVDEKVLVSYYDHNCEYISKYCEEYHKKYVRVPLSILKEYYQKGATEDAPTEGLSTPLDSAF